MATDEQIFEALAQVPTEAWEGEVFRHMFASFPPEKENSSGARWNPPETPAIYTSLTRETALAESEYQIGAQPRRPKAKRTLYKIAIHLSSVLNISGEQVLRSLSLKTTDLTDIDFRVCQAIGGAVERLGHDGLLVPSARARGHNLVIFPNRQKQGSYRFEVISQEVIDPGESW